MDKPLRSTTLIANLYAHMIIQQAAASITSFNLVGMASEWCRSGVGICTSHSLSIIPFPPFGSNCAEARIVPKQGCLKNSVGDLVASDMRAETLAEHLEKVQWAVRPLSTINQSIISQASPYNASAQL